MDDSTQPLPSQPTHTAQPSQPPNPSRAEEIFNRIRAWRAVRPDEGRWVSGTAIALAQRWNLDPLLVRGVLVALTVVNGLGLGLYGLAWLLLPQQDGRIHLQEALRGRISLGLAGAVFLSAGLLIGTGPWQTGDEGWRSAHLLLTLLALAGFALLSRRGAAPDTAGGVTPAPPPPWGADAPAAAPPAGPAGSVEPVGPVSAASWPSPAPPTPPPARVPVGRGLRRLTLGAMLVVAAALLVALRLDGELSGRDVVVVLATTVIVSAVGTVAAGLRGHRAGSVAVLGALLAVPTVLGAGATSADLTYDAQLRVAGEVRERPVSRAEAERERGLGVGSYRLDLTDPQLLRAADPDDPITVRLQTGAAEVTVLLPAQTSVDTVVQLQAGNLRLPDGGQLSTDTVPALTEGTGYTLHTGPDAPAGVTVQIEQGVGEVRLELVDSPVPTALTGSAA